jgi:hypothetical protein
MERKVRNKFVDFLDNYDKKEPLNAIDYSILTSFLKLFNYYSASHSITSTIGSISKEFDSSLQNHNIH